MLLRPISPGRDLASIRSAFRLSLCATLFAILGLSAQSANAANLYVDDNGQQCPAATFTSIQSAVDAAVMGDTVVVCNGTYSEGSGAQGTNGLTITKSISIRGAGADKVTIKPTVSGGQIAAASPVLRDGVGNIVSVNGTPEDPLTVNISGVTISGGGDKTYITTGSTPIWNGEFENGVYAETGVLYLDAGGSLTNSAITNVVTSELAASFSQPGGFRSNDLGWGVAQVTAATAAPSAASVPLVVDGTRIDRYNKGGLLIDGATGDTFPMTRSGVTPEATVTRTSVIGRNLNSPSLDGYAQNPATQSDGIILTNTLFGQDGVRVTSGASIDVNSSDIFQNLMSGAGGYTLAQRPNAAGVRLADAAGSTIFNSNIVANGFGVVNVLADGTTQNDAIPVAATSNYWGIANTTGSLNNGPDVSPVTHPNAATAPAPTIPPFNNPVNGTADGSLGSTSVHFKPFRSGNQADSNGQWPIQQTPRAVVNAAPTVTLEASAEEVSPGEQITLTADATDDFGVKTLEFFQGDDQIGSAVTPPGNSVTWTAPSECGAPQTVEFTVFATDSEGDFGYGEVSVDVDDCAPEIELSAGAAPSPLGAVKLDADASDDLGLAKIEFYVDGDLVHTATSPANGVTSYTFTPADPCGGGENYDLEAVATDTTGHETTSNTNFAREDCAPTVGLEANNTEVAPGASVNLTATAEDDDLVETLSYVAGSTSIGTSTNTNSDNPWVDTKSWTAPNQCGTSTVITVTAEDSADQTNTDTVTVTTTACPDTPPTVDLAANPTAVDPGGQVTLTATATDDDEVVSITFFEGSTQIGSVTPPNNSITWTAPETCNGSFTLKAVAEDSIGQTTEDTVTVTTNDCPPPAEPTVSIDSPPAKIAQNGTTVSATASGEAGLTKVTFHLGTRQVCEDTSAPYSCSILPNGSEVGASSIRAVVTDTLGRTAEDIESTTVSKFKPKGLKLNTKRFGAKKLTMKAYGKLLLPARTTAAVCKGSRVNITSKLGKKMLGNRQVKLANNCTYGLAFKAPKTKKKQRVVITVRFPGNSSLSATSKTRKVR